MPSRRAHDSALVFLCVQAGSRRGDICQIYVAFRCIPVPARHNTDRFCELGAVPLVDAAGIDPEVSQVVTSRLFAAEYDFAVAGFALARLVYQVNAIVRDWSARDHGVEG